MEPVVRDAPPVPYPVDGDGRRVTVTVRLQVGTDGKVRDVQWVRTDPRDASEAFVTAALSYARDLRFEPGRLDGDVVPFRFDHAVVFDPGIDGDDEPSADPTPRTAADAPVTAADPETPPANEAPGSATSDGETVRTVRVEGPSVPRREAVTGSDFDLDPRRLRGVPRTNAEQMLTLAPGFFLSNAGGEGHPSGVFLRGFDAGVGQDIEYVVDGVPINEVSNAHNHGYADPLFVIPELVQRLRVTEGPFDPRQGDFAVAATAAYELGMAERGVVTSGSYGSFDTGRFLTMWGPPGHGPGTFVAADLRMGDGFGINRSHRAARVLAGFEHRLARGWSIDLLAAGYATRFDQAGVLRKDDFDARRIPGCGSGRDDQFFCTYDPNQGGASSRFLAVAEAVHHRAGRTFRQNLWVTRRTMRQRENFTGFITDVRPDGAAQRGDGVEQRYTVVTTGARGSYRMRKDWRARPQELELGYGIRYDDGETIQRRLRFADGIPYATDFDNTLRVVDLGLYAASTVRPFDRLALDLGVRMDTYAFHVVARDLPASDRDGERETSEAHDAHGISVQPRASAVVEILRWPRRGRAHQDALRRVDPGFGSLEWMSAYGIGSRSSDATALSDGELAPFARVQSAETGLRWRWEGIADRFGFETRAVTFYTHVDRDLVFDPVAGRNTQVGESHRFGALGVLRMSVDEWLETQASVTWAEAHLPPPTAGPFDWTAGPRLPYVPRLVVRGDAVVFNDFWIREQPFDWSIGVGVSHVAPRPLPLNAFGTRYTVVDLAAKLRWRWIEGGISIQNLFDRRYHQFELFYASNFDAPSARPSMLPQLHFVPGPPLTALGTLTLYFEPDARERLRERRMLRRLEQESSS